MQSPVLTLLCLYGVGLSLVRADFMSSCPPSCTCKWSSGLRRADCSNSDFTTIPNFHSTGSDKTVQVLIMDGNYIKELPKSIFYSAGLSDVQKIYLKNCQIEKIHGDAFSKLNILTELNLEGNQITSLEPKTFDGNNRLETIVLSRNNIPLLTDYQFPQLRNLKKLDFSSTGLEEVRTTAFNYLSNLEDIDLSGNRLKMLDHKTFLSLKKLKTLNLRDNLWHCDCQLKSFREFTVQKSLNTGMPKCSEPERLAGKSWDKTSSLEFACKPDIKVQSEMVYAESGWNITLSCHITGNPVPSMRWVLNGRVIYRNTTRINHPGHHYHVQDKALGPGGIERNFSLEIDNVQWDDQGDYNCVAINQGGMAEKNITLTFSHPTTWGFSTSTTTTTTTSTRITRITELTTTTLRGGLDEDVAKKWDHLPKITKDFYKEQDVVKNRPTDEVDNFRERNNCIQVKNFNSNDKSPILNPTTTLEEAFLGYPEILETIRNQGFQKPSPIQSQMWPYLLNGKDVIGIAPTGTDKTLSFLLPAFIHIEGQTIQRRARKGANVLIYAPTRELSQQIDIEVKNYAYRGIRSVFVYDEGNIRDQLNIIKNGVEIIIATPGRFNHFVDNGDINLDGITYVVLDEADRMLNQGFEHEIRKTLISIRTDRTTVMTSATWQENVWRLVKNYMNEPVTVFVGSPELAAVDYNTKQINQVNVTPRSPDKTETEGGDYSLFIGIGVGIGILALCIILCVLYCCICCRRSTEKEADSDSEEETDDTEENKPIVKDNDHDKEKKVDRTNYGADNSNNNIEVHNTISTEEESNSKDSNDSNSAADNDASSKDSCSGDDPDAKSTNQDVIEKDLDTDASSLLSPNSPSSGSPNNGFTSPTLVNSKKFRPTPEVRVPLSLRGYPRAPLKAPKTTLIQTNEKESPEIGRGSRQIKKLHAEDGNTETNVPLLVQRSRKVSHRQNSNQEMEEVKDEVVHVPSTTQKSDGGQRNSTRDTQSTSFST